MVKLNQVLPTARPFTTGNPQVSFRLKSGTNGKMFNGHFHLGVM